MWTGGVGVGVGSWMKSGGGEKWAVGHLNEMYVRDVHGIQKNIELEGNLNYDNDVYSFLFDV